MEKPVPDIISFTPFTLLYVCYIPTYVYVSSVQTAEIVLFVYTDFSYSV